MARSEFSSILFRPIMRWPFPSIEEYREDTLIIGSPSVFQTAPPQPASNARITCSPVLAGGAEASQNGFGLLMPQKSIERSAISTSPSLPFAREESRGVAAVGHGVHDLFAAV